MSISNLLRAVAKKVTQPVREAASKLRGGRAEAAPKTKGWATTTAEQRRANGIASLQDHFTRNSATLPRDMAYSVRTSRGVSAGWEIEGVRAGKVELSAANGKRRSVGIGELVESNYDALAAHVQRPAPKPAPPRRVTQPMNSVVEHRARQDGRGGERHSYDMGGGQRQHLHVAKNGELRGSGGVRGQVDFGSGLRGGEGLIAQGAEASAQGYSAKVRLLTHDFPAKLQVGGEYHAAYESSFGRYDQYFKVRGERTFEGRRVLLIDRTHVAGGHAVQSQIYFDPQAKRVMGSHMMR